MTVPAEIDPLLDERTLAASFLVFMDFVDTPRRFWLGFGDLVTGGHTWQGMGGLITIDGLEEDRGTAANAMTFTLSGVDPVHVTLAQQASTRVKGRRVYVYLQFFDVDTQQPVGDPEVVKVATMDQMRYAAEGLGSRTITVTAEGLMAGRNQSPAALYTDRDQNLRFPGDRGLEQVPDLVSKTIRWPVF